MIFICTNTLCYAQNYKIDYNYKITAHHINLTTRLKSYLTGNGKTSIYEEDFMSGNHSTNDDNVLSIKTTENPIFYKNISKSIVTFNDHIRMKNFNIRDSIAGFEWKIVNETKTILGYSCQKAKLFFRGRNYEVYFTSQIPYSDGPVKFMGLPGMILEVNSNSPTYSYEIIAEKVELKNNSLQIENPYSFKDVIPYGKFIEIYKKKYYEALGNADQYGSGIMEKGTQEIYITD